MGDDAHQLVAVGLSHHTAPVDIREMLALDEDGVRAELSYLRAQRLVREAMVISTCNRVEMYLVPEGGSDAAGRLRDDFRTRRAKGRALDDYLYWLYGRDGVRHLFRVAASLDSLVIGEPQILGQVKDAVRLAEESHALGAILHRLSQRTLWVAKQVRTHTDIGRFNVGIGNAGVSLAQQIFSTLRGRRALLVGVGEMGRQVAKAMLDAGIDELIVANRTFARAVELAETFGGTPVRFDRMHDYLPRVDIVITATGARRPILGTADVKAALRARRYRPLFLVDLAVPRNIAAEVGELAQAYLFNVDDLQAVMDRGKRAREAASAEAERFVDHETERFNERLAALEVNDAIGAIVRHAEDLRIEEVERSRRLLQSLDATQRADLDAMTQALVKKLLHHPLNAIRAARKAEDARALQALVDAWGLEGLLDDEAGPDRDDPAA